MMVRQCRLEEFLVGKAWTTAARGSMCCDGGNGSEEKEEAVRGKD